MRLRRVTNSHTIFTVPGHEDLDGDAISSTNSEEIAIRVSTMGLDQPFSTSWDCLSILVLINEPRCHAAEIMSSDEAGTSVLRYPGDTCILPPRLNISPSASSGAQVIRYEASKRSLKAFSDRTPRSEKESLLTPHFVTDSFLLVLSRTVRPLLSDQVSCTKEFGKIFALSFYRYVFERYGAKASEKERFIGGLSPQHKRIFDEALDSSNGYVLSIDTIAERCGLSSRHFARAFRQSFGVPFYRHLTNLRLGEAKRLLIGTGRTLKQIAEEIGYSDQATFTESFTAAVGISPGRFRRRYGMEVTKEPLVSQVSDNLAMPELG